MDILKYNPKLKQRARELRKNSTRSEIKLWKALRAGNLLGYSFNRQKPIDQFIVDFYCKKLHLVIEIDGDSHNEKLKYDRRRQDRLEELGLVVIRFYDHDVMKNLDGVLQKLEEVVEELRSRKG